jgi:uncharacterized protein YbdZ (MbtH family)
MNESYGIIVNDANECAVWPSDREVPRAGALPGPAGTRAEMQDLLGRQFGETHPAPYHHVRRGASLPVADWTPTTPQHSRDLLLDVAERATEEIPRREAAIRDKLGADLSDHCAWFIDRRWATFGRERGAAPVKAAKTVD